MSFNAKVFNVMIASPSDVESEREIIRKVIYKWNCLHSEKTKIILLPLGWETHSSPLMGDTPQNIINKYVTDKGDFLIGVFWTRIGTKTDNAISGSIDEINKHINQNKPVLLYFSNVPIKPQNIQNDQYEQLVEFKKSCCKKGLVKEYESIEQFEKSLMDHLIITISENEFFKIPEPSEIESFESKNSLNLFDKIINELPKEIVDFLVKCSEDECSIMLEEFIGDEFMIIAYDHLEMKGKKNLVKWKKFFNELESFELITIENKVSGLYCEITYLGYEFAEYCKKIGI